MPDFWTHLIAGEEITAGIKDDDIKSLLNRNYQLFNFASQGADFFFYNDFWPWQTAKEGPEKGELVHSLRGKKLFAEVLKVYKKEGIYLESELPESEYWQHNLVYLLGFISHYALDRDCHPFILQNGGRGKKHKLIEASIDIYIMQEKWDQNPKNINPLPYYQLQEEYLENLNFYYQQIFNNLLGGDLDQELIWESYLDLRKYHSVFYCRDAKKYYLFRLLNLVLPQNLSQHCYALNEREEVWPAENYQEFEHYFAGGIESALELIEQTLNYFQSEISLSELLNIFGEKNFLGEK